MSDKELQERLELVKDVESCSGCKIVATVIQQILATRPRKETVVGFVNDKLEEDHETSK